MACGLHGPHSCSPAWGDLRLPGMGCISSFPPSSWQGTGRELGREHTLPKAALKPAWQTQTRLWGPQSPLVSLVPAEEGRREGERGTHTTGAAFPYRTARCSAHMPTGSAAPWGCSLPSLPCHSSSHACGSTWETGKERVWVSSCILPVGTIPVCFAHTELTTAMLTPACQYIIC